MRKLVLVIAFFAFFVVMPAASAADDEIFLPPQECFAAPHKWAYNRSKETIAEAGMRFLEDVRKCAPTFAASVVEAVRYEVQDQETKIFARHSRFVMWAYGIAWAVVAACAVLLLLRQERLQRNIVDLERKLRTAVLPPKP